jgi:hypothetical protein
MGSSGGFAEALPYGAGGSARIRLYRRLLLDHGDRTQQYTVVGFRIPSVEAKNLGESVTSMQQDLELTPSRRRQAVGRSDVPVLAF